ncbi:MAG TPA: ATP-binding protein [Methylomirabilota bacterium]|nr:ATP-binding protein [Methylomirabilota bacterium]
MPGAVNCIYTKSLIPLVERELGEAGVASLLRAAGHSREYLTADHNWLPLSLVDALSHLAMSLLGETDEARWGRRWGEYHMDWKPSHDERSYLGGYTMGLGSPRAVFARLAVVEAATNRVFAAEVLEMGRSRALVRATPTPGHRIPLWMCSHARTMIERFPTNWNLPRAVVTELACAATGAPACVWQLRWKNPPIGARFWGPLAAGAVVSAGLTVATAADGWLAHATAVLPLIAGATAGAAWRERRQRREIERLRDIQSDEILHSANQLEGKFRDLETKIEQLSLLIDLSAAVNATLDIEKIYEQALDRLVHRMGYQAANLLLVDAERRVVRAHRSVGDEPRRGGGAIEFDLDAPDSLAARVARTGLPIIVNDVEAAGAPIHLATARALGVRSVVAVPLRVKDRIFGVLNVVARTAGRFAESDVDLLAAVANNVALAVDRAESFQTIEDLSRGLEDKVHVRTEQLRAANEEVAAAYRELQSAQVQLIQREKMATVGQLVAGVAHELNNPIGFIYSNIGTLDDFVTRLRRMLETYRATPLPRAEQAAVQERWETLKVDYALRYLDSMIQGIREGAERSRKIVRDLRVFARGQDEAWQSVDLHEEIESSLTLLDHTLKDRVTVERRFGTLPAVECIRSQMDQVFLNLLANAGQAIEGPGRITIETGEDGEHVVVTISDSGPGIAADVLGRIFDPFFTTKPVGEGTGLGLSISYEIVKKHGGELTAESPAGGGARFRLRIPRQRRAA